MEGKKIEIKLSKTYKSSLVNEEKLKTYLKERFYAPPKQNRLKKL